MRLTNRPFLGHGGLNDAEWLASSRPLFYSNQYRSHAKGSSRLEAPHLKKFLDRKPDPALYKNHNQIARLEEVTGVQLLVKEPLCFDVYNRKIRTDGTCITITEPHHNGMRIVEPKKGDKPWVRKLSIQEHYRLMGFADGEFEFGDFSYQQLCKRAGNGWDINVVSLLLRNIFPEHITRS